VPRNLHPVALSPVNYVDKIYLIYFIYGFCTSGVVCTFAVEVNFKVVLIFLEHIDIMGAIKRRRLVRFFLINLIG